MVVAELANEGFYDGVVFHRVIPGFMAQGGDPSGTGMHGSDKPNLKQEFSKEPHVRGVCSMARTNDPNSANSQFFICFDDATFPDGQHTWWGEVTGCMGRVDGRPQGGAARQTRRPPAGPRAQRGPAWRPPSRPDPEAQQGRLAVGTPESPES